MNSKTSTMTAERSTVSSEDILLQSFQNPLKKNDIAVIPSDSDQSQSSEVFAKQVSGSYNFSPDNMKQEVVFSTTRKKIAAFVCLFMSGLVWLGWPAPAHKAVPANVVASANVAAPASVAPAAAAPAMVAMDAEPLIPENYTSLPKAEVQNIFKAKKSFLEGALSSKTPISQTLRELYQDKLSVLQTMATDIGVAL